MYQHILEVYQKYSAAGRPGAGARAGPGGATLPPLGISYILVYLYISWMEFITFLAASKVELPDHNTDTSNRTVQYEFMRRSNLYKIPVGGSARP